MAGDLGAAEHGFTAALATARRFHDQFVTQNVLGQLASIALLRGDLDRVRDIQSEAAGPPNYVNYFPAVGLAEFEGVIDVSEALPSLDIAGAQEGFLALGHALRARIYFIAGDCDQARSEIAEWKLAATGVSGDGIEYLTNFGPALAACGDDDVVHSAYGTLMQMKECRTGTGWVNADEMRGSLALRLDLVDEAEQHFRTGLDWCERERCPVEAGRNLQGLAEIAEQRGEREQAMEYLDRAGELFSRHGAKLYLDQVLAKKDILKA